MKKFQFKFETVLEHRKTREEDALRALAVAQRAHREELDRKSRLIADLDSALSRRADLTGNNGKMSAIRLEDDFIEGNKRRMAWADQAIARAAKTVEKATRTYMNARRQTRVMEILRERALTEYRRELNRREARDLDEMSIMRARFREEIA